MFKELYYLKREILMLENLREGNAFMEELFEEFVKHHEKPLNACYLESQIVDFRYIINSHIPKDVKENWTYCDMEIFTDKFHYRKYFNEIENDKATEYFLELILETLGVATNDGNETNFSLRLYDFNDYDIYFKSEEDANAFIEKYSIDTCTGFAKENDEWIESWSI